MNFLRLLIPLLSFIAGTLTERFGNLPLWAGLAIIAFAVILLWVYTGVPLLKKMGRISGIPVWLVMVVLFSGLGVVVSSLSPRGRETDAMRVPEYKAWRKSVNPDAVLSLRVKSVFTGEYGDVLKGELTNAGKWTGWGITSYCGATMIKPGDVVAVPAKSVQGGYANASEVVVLIPASYSRDLPARLHRALVGCIERAKMDSSTHKLLLALLAGETSAVSSDFRSALANAGLAHMLALSGMHVAIIASVILLILWPLNLWGLWKIRWAVAAVMVWLFVLASGMAPSTIRAAVMFSAVSAALISERKRRAGDAIIIAAFLILFFNPDAIATAGFQLSFLCVWALVAFVEPLNKIDRHRHKRLHSTVTWLLVPMVAWTSSWILSAYYFGAVPLGFLSLNLIAVPILPIYVGLAIFYIAMSVCGFHIVVMQQILDNAPRLLVSAAESAGSGSVINFMPDKWMLVIWFSLLILFACLLRERSKPTV